MLLDAVLIGLVVYYLTLAPYTKVEESFNIQAIHDILFFGLDVGAYDHNEFPGVVPRSFIGAAFLAAATKLTTLLYPFSSKLDLQIVSRGILGLLNGAALLRFKSAVAKTYGSRRGKQVGNWFLFLCLGEFHLIFYASRTLPNMLAMPLVLLAYCAALNDNYYRCLVLLTLTAAIFRLELVLLAASFGLVYLFYRRITFFKGIGAGLLGGGLGASLSTLVDSWFWQHLTWPELQGLLFNVVQGQSSLWGVEPFGHYFMVHLPNLMGNPLVLFFAILGLSVTPRRLQMTGYACALYVLVYSLQPHKEWRFIIYVVPVFTALAARGIDYIFYRQWHTVFGKLVTLVMVGSSLLAIAVSLLKAETSAENYPGGHALEVFHAISSEPRSNAKTVHIDVTTCMTGASRFGQEWPLTIYDKTEDPKELEQAWPSFDYYIGTASLESLPGNWKKLESISAFQAINKPLIKSMIDSAIKDPKAAMHTVVDFVYPIKGLNDRAHTLWQDLIELQDTVFIYERQG